MTSTAAIPNEALIVDPGASVRLEIRVSNPGPEPEDVELVLEGIDPEWIAVPQPTKRLEPNTSDTFLVLFRPARSSESAAGDYPFVARIRALSGEPGERALSGILRVRAYHHLALEISPKKGSVSPVSRANTFDLSITNLGNSDHSLLLSGSDPEDECAYEFDHENVAVGPGQSRDTLLTVSPRSRKALSSSRLIGFNVAARSVETPTIVSTTGAQLEVKPLLSPTMLAFLVLVAGLVGALWFLQPKPPRVTSLTVDHASVARGEPVTVGWRTTDAGTVNLRVGGNELPDKFPAEGTYTFQPNDVGSVEVSAVAMRDDRRSDPERVSVQVSEPIPVPEPKITSLAPSAKTVRVGQSFVLKYAFNEAVTSAKISPLGKELDLSLDSIQIPTDTPGAMEFTVVAENKAGKRTSKSFTIDVTDPSQASIVDFLATPKEVESDGMVTVTWTITGASAIRLTYGDKFEDLTTATGTREIPITAKTTFTLRATDARGKSVSRSVTVRVKAPPPPAEPATNDPANDAGNVPTTPPGDPVLPENVPGRRPGAPR